jgi:predicted enzyme related to lactoylglutathione lyase
MHGHLTHFAVNADDLPATRRFYEALFGWRFTEAYPGFWRTTDAGPAIGAIHGGRILMPKSTIPGVGELVFLADPSGNVTGAMRYSA